MTSTRKFKSETLAAIHDAAGDQFEVGATTKTTMREFDAACIATPTPLAPADITRMRQHLHVSQPVFARYLNTTESTVAKWESGAKRPIKGSADQWVGRSRGQSPWPQNGSRTLTP